MSELSFASERINSSGPSGSDEESRHRSGHFGCSLMWALGWGRFLEKKKKETWNTTIFLGKNMFFLEFLSYKFFPYEEMVQEFWMFTRCFVDLIHKFRRPATALNPQNTRAILYTKNKVNWRMIRPLSHLTQHFLLKNPQQPMLFTPPPKKKKKQNKSKTQTPYFVFPPPKKHKNHNL